MSAPKKTNYLNNKDLLKEIHNSKKSFSSYDTEAHSNYDLIITIALDAFTEADDALVFAIINDPGTIDDAKRVRAKKMQEVAYNAAMVVYNKTLADLKPAKPKAPKVPKPVKPKQRDFLVDINDIEQDSLVFRVMSYAHIPEAPGRKKKPKNISETLDRVNFPPFRHYVLSDTSCTEVCKSHWEGSISNGQFSVKSGRISNTLGAMFLKLVERFSYKSNWRGYTYTDEMRGTALVNLSQVGLQFNEAKSNNPFAYYTAAANNSFTRILLLEKKNQKMRDDILIQNGFLPSYGRQLEHEDQMRKMRTNPEWDMADYKSTGPQQAFNGMTPDKSK